MCKKCTEKKHTKYIKKNNLKNKSKTTETPVNYRDICESKT